MHHQRDILISRVAGLVLVPECLQRPVKFPVYDIHILLLRLHKTHASSQGCSWRQYLLGYLPQASDIFQLGICMKFIL